MDKDICNVLDGKWNNYVLPFFWQHGEEESIIREEMIRIYESCIGAVCVESRPHPDFAGPRWWRDMDIIIDEAKKLGMRVWVLDDSHFPTGYANGWIKDRYPEKGKIYLIEKHADACGPLKNASFIFDGWLKKGDQILAVIASKRTGRGEDVDDTLLDITENVCNSTLYWDVPEGLWRIFTLFVSSNGGGNPNYINPIDPDSVRVLIDAVYEPHFARYKKDFGRAFAGFFSDEPGMGNTKGYNFDESIGRKKMALPWSKEVPQLLKNEMGNDYKRYLPSLWYDSGKKTPVIRYKYMDMITRLYDKSFTRQLGDWCRSHGVEYIGHVIEDQNNHARLGPSTGHFFRALGGQDMSGVDVVIQQILPGFDCSSHDFYIEIDIGNKKQSIVKGTWDGVFFHYALAKMASSIGHIDPLKKGRTMCEIYGAYGWMEGLKLMKWLTDHMLVRGINWLVPHAFSPHEYPDLDCPPHFYARGRNPQYRYFKILMQYANRICHFFNDGIHIAPIVILYHAEAEWSGEYMFFQKPACVLAQNQIDYDIIPSDVFSSMNLFNAHFDGNKFTVNGEEYSCLIVPYSQYITSATAKFIANAVKYGFEIIFIDKLPEGICDEDDTFVSTQLLDGLKACENVSLDKLVSFLHNKGLYEIKISEVHSYLRYYHYHKNEADFYMFFNEHPYNEINTIVNIPLAGMVSLYNAFDNLLESANIDQYDNTTKLQLNLSPYESVIVIFGEVDGKYLNTIGKKQTGIEVSENSSQKVLNINSPWRLSLALATEYPDFTYKMELINLRDISSPEYFPDFSGTMRYETVFNLEVVKGNVLLDLGKVYETAEVWVNGLSVGVRICPPYYFDITGTLIQGLNTLRIDVTNTLVRERRDIISTCAVLEPSGLLGPVILRRKL